jgi:hypothetical protein
MGIMNKQDYARWHSYQFYLSVGNVDPTIRPEGSLDVSAFPLPMCQTHIPIVRTPEECITCTEGQRKAATLGALAELGVFQPRHEH